MRRALLPLLVGALALTGCGSGSASRGDRAPDRADLAGSAPPVTVVAVGDIACPPGGTVTRTTCRQAATAKRAVRLAPSRVIVLGDNQYQRGTRRAYLRSYDRSWGQLLGITWPVPGNHEYETTGARGYYRYFTGRQPGSPGYYRRELGGWQLYLLNSNCAAIDCRAEKEWLRAQLTANPSTCSLIAFHHPRFSSGGEHGSNRGMNRFWKVAYEHHVDVALSGHDHDMERFDPMSPDGVVQRSRGIQQFVSGGGGKNLYRKGATETGSRFFRSRFGILQLTLRSADYSWRFVGPRGRVWDSGTAPCR